MDPFQAINSFLNSPLIAFAVRAFELTAILIWLMLAVWAYRDAKARGAIAPLWAAIALFVPYIGALVYLLARPPEYAKDVEERELEIRAKQRTISSVDLKCPSCQNGVEQDYIVCPHCMKRLKKICSNCHKPLNMSWSACPWCGNIQELQIRLNGKGGTT